jgi:4,4'-diaponeurosporenoate glycosyltransferase
VLWIAGCIIALSHPLTYVLSAFQIALLLRRFGNYRLPTALLYPLPLLFFFAVFARSLLQTRTGTSILWKGRPVGAV